MLTKLCKRCGIEKDSSCFNVDKSLKDGLRTYCKECTREYSRQHRLSRIDHYRELGRKWKTEHADERRAYSKQYYTKNKDKISAYQKEWRNQSDEHRAMLNKRSSDWEKAHHSHSSDRYRAWREDNPERYRTNQRNWRSKNRDRKYMIEHRRRARLRGNGGSYTQEEWRLLCEKHGNACAACKQCLPLTVDHIIPVFLGGPNTIGNIQPLCRFCNSKKHTKITDYRLEGSL